MLADQLRREKHPEGTASYALGPPAGLSLEETVKSAAAHGSNDVSLERIAETKGVPLPKLQASLMAALEQNNSVRFHDLPTSQVSRLPDLTASLASLRAGGLVSLVFGLNAVQPDRHDEDVKRFLATAQMLDLSTRASLTIGQGESIEQRLDALSFLRNIQQEMQAFPAVQLCVQHANTPDARREEDATAVDYLKTLAVTRLFLSDFDHVQTGWSIMGPKVLELALRFGADDAGVVAWSQEGDSQPSHHGGEAELRRIVRDAGFRPVERDALFRQSLLR
ncbi:MAG: radical domain protein [Acidobacteriaceae bacterium]|nr:radical domain protein [Acidobacteriaceae bacterium]